MVPVGNAMRCRPEVDLSRCCRFCTCMFTLCLVTKLVKGESFSCETVCLSVCRIVRVQSPTGDTPVWAVTVSALRWMSARHAAVHTSSPCPHGPYLLLPASLVCRRRAPSTLPVNYRIVQLRNQTQLPQRPTRVRSIDQ